MTRPDCIGESLTECKSRAFLIFWNWKLRFWHNSRVCVLKARSSSVSFASRSSSSSSSSALSSMVVKVEDVDVEVVVLVDVAV